VSGEKRHITTHHSPLTTHHSPLTWSPYDLSFLLPQEPAGR
jgi:hypothetical protein